MKPNTLFEESVVLLARRVLETRNYAYGLEIAWGYASKELQAQCFAAAWNALEELRPAMNTSPKVIALITPSEPYGRSLSCGK